MTTRRVLFVCHTHPRLTQGGTEIVAEEEFQRAQKTPGTEAWFLTHDAGMLPVRLGAPIVQPFGPREFLYTGRAFNHFLFSNPDPNFAEAFAALLRELRPEVVRFHHFLGVGLEALALARRALTPAPRIELVLHEYLLICHHYGQMVKRPGLDLCRRADPVACTRCFPEESPQRFFLRELWIRRFLQDVDEFVSPSAFLRQRFIEWGLPAERITVRENVLPARAAAPPRRRAAVPRIGFFGQMSELKGIGVLLRAAAHLRELGWAGVIDVHGSMEHQPEELRQRLERLLADAPPNVLLHGRYDNEDVSALMARCDAVVVPSIWWENSPLVIQEAIRAGRPVIGSDIGGVGEKTRAAPGGILFRAGDPIDLAQAVLSLEPRADAPAPSQSSSRTPQPGA